MTALLQIEDLHLQIAEKARRTPILRGLSLAIERRAEVHGLVGESGAGKTMVGKVVARHPAAGRGGCHAAGCASTAGTSTRAMTERQRRAMMGQGISLIPQDPMTSLNPAFRIGGQITDVLRLRMGMDGRAARRRALDLLEDVSIRKPDTGHAPIRARAVGRHAPARADRDGLRLPAQADHRRRADDGARCHGSTPGLLRLIKDLQDSAGTAILFITHDLGVVAKICDTMTVICIPAAASSRGPSTRSSPGPATPTPEGTPQGDAALRPAWRDAGTGAGRADPKGCLSEAGGNDDRFSGARSADG